MTCTRLAATALLATIGSLTSGCTNSPPSIPSSSSAAAGSTEADPLARAMRVASTVARARTCSLSIDAAKLKANYLNYELKQGVTGSQAARVEKAFDASAIAPEPSACSVDEITELKRNLGRYRAGLFAPQNKGAPNGSFEPKAFWKEQDDSG